VKCEAAQKMGLACRVTKLRALQVCTPPTSQHSTRALNNRLVLFKTKNQGPLLLNSSPDHPLHTTLSNNCNVHSWPLPPGHQPPQFHADLRAHTCSSKTSKLGRRDRISLRMLLSCYHQTAHRHRRAIRHRNLPKHTIHIQRRKSRHLHMAWLQSGNHWRHGRRIHGRGDANGTICKHSLCAGEHKE